MLAIMARICYINTPAPSIFVEELFIHNCAALNNKRSNIIIVPPSRLARIWPKPVQIWSDIGPSLAELGPTLPTWPISRHNLPRSCRFRDDRLHQDRRCAHWHLRSALVCLQLRSALLAIAARKEKALHR